MKKPKFLFYATLLDSFQNYLNSSETYQKYWGSSENPSKTEEEYELEAFQSLIDSINRVPFESEAADKGTAFNEVIDCIIERRKSEKMRLETLHEEYIVDGIQTKGKPYGIKCDYKEHSFIFPYDLCIEFANYYKGGICQVYCEAPIETKYGTVLLYGYIDELLPESVHDIKTTKQYKVSKYIKNWQHIVYPYCLNASGNMVKDFEYNIAVFDENRYSTYTEHYNYIPERDEKKLKEHVEHFIRFININRELITDKKIFNQYEN